MSHKEVIFKGSKSFSLASLFFSKKEKIACWKLYSWCRYCDDLIDEASDPTELDLRLETLKSNTSHLLVSKTDHFNMSGMYDVIHEFTLPMKYPMDLLGGMEMDVKGTRFSSLSKLENYCYCVAGTVGLMMCHILGIRDEVALSHAVSLGNAMQLTNIARDIREDHLKGRLYLPLDWLREKGINEETFCLDNHKEYLIEMQERLLVRADELYQEGLTGLCYLSARSAWAVLLAAMIYAEIGKVIRSNPRLSLEKRAVVSGKRKLMIVAKSFLIIIPVMISQFKHKNVAPPQSIWSSNS